METIDVSSCVQLIYQNERLKKKVCCLKKENSDLKRRLYEYCEAEKRSELLRQYATMRDSSVQTEVSKPVPVRTCPAHKKSEIVPDSTQVTKLLAIHGTLMKRYEKELKANLQNVDKIAELTLKVNLLEERLRCRDDDNRAKKRLDGGTAKEDRQAAGLCGQWRDAQGRSKDYVSLADYANLGRELRMAKREKEELAHDKRKLIRELKGLDQGFFDEVEDMKFSLQQSIRLNAEYEATVKSLCTRFSVPLPHLTSHG